MCPLRRRMPVVCSATGALFAMKWSRASVLPRVSPDPKSGGFAVSLARDGHNCAVVVKWRPVRVLLP